MILRLDTLKSILSRYPDSMECFIRDNKLVCSERTNLVKSELVIEIPEK
jgi:hypothetical protein